MRVLLDSSWMKFGPAGRGSYDWVTGPPSTPEKQGHNWNELELVEDRKSELVVYVLLPVASVLLLALLVGLVYRRWSRSGKLSLANVIALDLPDTESSTEFLCSLTRNASRHTSTSSDGSDGVFVMVYLPPPYEETLTKVTRAASLSSSRDVESVKMDDLEAALCPELRGPGTVEGKDKSTSAPVSSSSSSSCLTTCPAEGSSQTPSARRRLQLNQSDRAKECRTRTQRT